MINKSDVIKRSKDIEALLRDSEHEALYDLSQQYIKENGIAIEIGSWRGGSSVIIGSVCKEKNAHLYCVDAFSTNMHEWSTVDKDQINRFIDNTKDLPLSIVSGDSTKIHSFIQDGCADFVFIDGDHQYDFVKADINNYRKKLKPDGLLCGHDYVPVGPVKDAVDELLGVESIKTISTIWICNHI
jgi:predicted O-methyltransferase YrrM